MERGGGCKRVEEEGRVNLQIAHPPMSETACVSAAEPERHKYTWSASAAILSLVRLLMYVPARSRQQPQDVVSASRAHEGTRNVRG